MSNNAAHRYIENTLDHLNFQIKGYQLLKRLVENIKIRCMTPYSQDRCSWYLYGEDPSIEVYLYITNVDIPDIGLWVFNYCPSGVRMGSGTVKGRTDFQSVRGYLIDTFGLETDHGIV